MHFGPLSLETINSDPGLSLLNNVVNSSDEYLYSVASSVAIDIRTPLSSSGDLLTLGVSDQQRGSLALNLSVTPRGDYPKNSASKVIDLQNSFDGLPSGGYSGSVTVSPNAGDATVSIGDKNIPLSRSYFTFHELKENYLRTSEGKSYSDAHSQSKEAGKAFHGIPQGWDQKKLNNPYERRYIKPQIKE